MICRYIFVFENCRKNYLHRSHICNVLTTANQKRPVVLITREESHLFVSLLLVILPLFFIRQCHAKFLQIVLQSVVENLQSAGGCVLYVLMHFSDTAGANKNSRPLLPSTCSSHHAVRGPFNWCISIAKLTYNATAERRGESRGQAGGSEGYVREFILLSSLRNRLVSSGVYYHLSNSILLWLHGPGWVLIAPGATGEEESICFYLLQCPTA